MHKVSMTMTVLLPLLPVAGAAEAADIQRSIEFAAPAEEVWDQIGDFCAIATWHPEVESCAIDEDDFTVYRTFQTEDGGTFREQLLEQQQGALFVRPARALAWRWESSRELVMASEVIRRASVP